MEPTNSEIELMKRIFIEDNCDQTNIEYGSKDWLSLEHLRQSGHILLIKEAETPLRPETFQLTEKGRRSL